MKNKYFVILIPAVVLVLSGCGNVAKARLWSSKVSNVGSPATAADGNGTITGTGIVTQTDYICPGTQNILPDWDIWFDGSNRFSACTNQKTYSSILIRGRLASGTSICVFPAQYVDATHIYTKPVASGATQGLPEFICKPMADAGVIFDYTGITYNYLFIVAEADSNSMQGCLKLGSYYSCPSYSYGKFR